MLIIGYMINTNLTYFRSPEYNHGLNKCDKGHVNHYVSVDLETNKECCPQCRGLPNTAGKQLKDIARRNYRTEGGEK